MAVFSKLAISFISIVGIVMSPSCAAEPTENDIHCLMNGVELSIPKGLLFGPATLADKNGQAQPTSELPPISKFGFSLDPINYQPIAMVHSMDLRNRLPRFKEELIKIPILVSVMALEKNRTDINKIPRNSYEDLASTEFSENNPYENFDENTEMYKLHRDVAINKSDNDTILLSRNGDLLVMCERLVQVVSPYADISQCNGVFVSESLKSSVGFYFSRVDLENVAKIKDAITRALSDFIVNRGGSRG